ncbi:SIS domain-containing protein [Chlamydiota bacterium]
MDEKTELKKSIEEHQQLLTLLQEKGLENIIKVVEVICDAFRNGSKLLLCGNGGSAADAQHTAAEFVNRFCLERNPLPALSLTTDTSVLTSIANDFDFDLVFSKQIIALGNEGDILIVLSTSGKSQNVIAAAKRAKEKNLITIGLVGRVPNPLAELVDICFDVPSESTPRIQEIHSLILHVICDLVEKRLVKSSI